MQPKQRRETSSISSDRQDLARDIETAGVAGAREGQRIVPAAAFRPAHPLRPLASKGQARKGCMVGFTLKAPLDPTSSTLPRPSSLVPPASRRELLREELLTTVDMLHRRRADLVAHGFLEDYVALR